MNRAHVLIAAGAVLGLWTVTAVTAERHSACCQACARYYVGPRPVSPRLTLAAGFVSAALAGTGAAMLATGHGSVIGLARSLTGAVSS